MSRARAMALRAALASAVLVCCGTAFAQTAAKAPQGALLPKDSVEAATFNRT